ncbi:MAG: asparagine synthase (glutamine-hydrolyzing) [Deltaproteobacteria bacterium]|nr:asparagine synthase (glutamine-hydrolyzing) [Deltaproteobacteria bacterium]MBW2075082.1 asparagine synthase (glutamine-hydrolyzing) [Deltaproteobacteria bacterium]
MCGIAGFFLKEGKASKAPLIEAAASLHHRGPDEKGYVVDGRVGLAHSRLSIIDVGTGQQPMANEDESVWITYNGEVYNFPDLRQTLLKKGHKFKTKSDTETVIHLYEEYGEGCLNYMRGMFSFALWDRNEGLLFLARDRIGVKPLVYTEQPEGFYFASEIQGLFSLNESIPRKINYRGIDFFFTFQYIPSPMTGYRFVSKLPPGHFMVVKDGLIKKISCYWDLAAEPEKKIDYDEACEGLRSIFLEATKMRMISDVPIGAFLSGGIDSSLTVAAMSMFSDTPVKTYSIGFEDESFNELPYARQIADRYGTDHNEMIVKPKAIDILPNLVKGFGEPMADSSAIPTYYVSNFAGRDLKVVLTGDGGDESFGGYRRFTLAARADYLDHFHSVGLWICIRKIILALERLFNKRRRHKRFPTSKGDEILTLNGLERYHYLLAFFSDNEKDLFYTKHMKEMTGSHGTLDYLRGFMERYETDDIFNRYFFIDQKTYLPEDILFKVDICSMMNSLESRSPLLDHKLIEFAVSLPGNYKRRLSGEGKLILKDTFRDWLPESFKNRSKMGFSAPVPRWLREDLFEYLQDELLANTNLHEIVKSEMIKRLLEEHGSGVKSHAKKLWTLLVLGLWLKLENVAL